MNKIVEIWRDRTIRFKEEADTILSKYGSSKSRVLTAVTVKQKLSGLSLKQNSHFDEAIRCIEYGCYKAAHVMAWAACFDFLSEFLGTPILSSIKTHRPKWKFTTKDELLDNYKEYEIIEALKLGKILTRNETRAFHGLLGKRNECAHPTGYEPGPDEALGYINEIFNRINTLKTKYPKIPPP